MPLHKLRERVVKAARMKRGVGADLRPLVRPPSLTMRTEEVPAESKGWSDAVGAERASTVLTARHHHHHHEPAAPRQLLDAGTQGGHSVRGG
jgi:hypothetical protein